MSIFEQLRDLLFCKILLMLILRVQYYVIYLIVAIILSVSIAELLHGRCRLYKHNQVHKVRTISVLSCLELNSVILSILRIPTLITNHARILRKVLADSEYDFHLYLSTVSLRNSQKQASILFQPSICESLSSRLS